MMIRQIKSEMINMTKDELIKQHLHLVYKRLNKLNISQLQELNLSYYNYLDRSQLECSRIMPYIKIGSVVFCDFGDTYLHESAFLHMGLVLTIYREKAFIIPMTSKKELIVKYRKIVYKDHLYYIGKVGGLSKESVLFLNDGKFVNSARIIDIKGYLDINSLEFLKIKSFYRQLFDV